MVKASSLSRNGFSSYLNKKYLIIAFVLLILLIGIFWFVNRSDSGDNSIQKAQSRSVDEKILNEISNLKFPVSQPAVVPTNFARTNVDIVTPKASKTKCEEVRQNYQGSSDPDVAFIDIYSYSSSCSYPRPDDAENYSVGDYSGWVSNPETKNDLTSLFEITVNQGMVRIESDLTETQLRETLSKFVKFSNVQPKDTAKIIVK